MSCTRHSWLIERYFNNLLDTSIIRPGDALNGFRNAVIRPDAILKGWNFFKANWDTVYRRYIKAYQ